MLKKISTYLKDFSGLLFPHYCEGCGTDVLEDKDLLCVRCTYELPETSFFSVANNPVEKIFYGRVKIKSAGAAYYFTKNSLIQHLLVQLKYKNNPEAGIFLGRLMGYMLKESERFSAVDALIPLPLNTKKLEIRGYNQAAKICEGINEIWSKPILLDAVERIQFTETQTHQNRTNRWLNMQGVFALKNSTPLQGKHVLLVDDVVTTGATLEACASTLTTINKISVSIATLAYTIQ